MERFDLDIKIINHLSESLSMKVELSCWCMILLKAFLWVVMMYIDSLIKSFITFMKSVYS